MLGMVTLHKTVQRFSIIITRNSNIRSVGNTRSYLTLLFELNCIRYPLPHLCMCFVRCKFVAYDPCILYWVAPK